MPEDIEIETDKLQEAIHKLHEEQQERHAELERSKWTQYIGLSTAIFAVFAAIGALESGSLVNEAMIAQIKASDAWNEYQSDKQKVHIYGLQANMLVDHGARPENSDKPLSKHERLSPGKRLSQYLDQIEKDNSKTDELSKRAKELEKESTELMHKHHRFAYMVTAIQISIALGAVAALTRLKWVFIASLGLGLVGMVLFVNGIL